MEFRQPSDQLGLFKLTTGFEEPDINRFTSTTQLYDWFRQPVRLSSSGNLTQRQVSVVAENILTLIIAPYEPDINVLETFATSSSTPYQIAPDYLFDSRRFQWDGGSALGLTTRHQLPPNVEITVIALDASEWDNLSDAEATSTGHSLVNFVNGHFSNAVNYRNDIDSITRELDRRRLSYRVFTRVIPLNGSAGRLFPLPASS